MAKNIEIYFSTKSLSQYKSTDTTYDQPDTKTSKLLIHNNHPHFFQSLKNQSTPKQPQKYTFSVWTSDWLVEHRRYAI